MILVIDVGNTNIVLGVYNGKRLIASWRMMTAKNQTADEIGIFIHSLFDYSEVDADEIEAVIISSVVPNVMYSLVHGLVKYFHIQPMIVGAGMKTGVNLLMDNPKEMGADRIVKLIAAYEIYGGPAMVIDYSTATTFDVINENGVFVTGITAPGIQICADALIQSTAQLPKVEIKRPKSIIVKNTIGSLQAGIIYGHIGETKYIIEQTRKELNIPNLKIIATGGLAKILECNGPLFDVIDPLLTLKGLRILYEKNKKPKADKK
ncbi:MAG: type III pantothenate kinase [Candidatus Metalachnospira sp.]|nr:type III pantothenate kinase [Candidatus Metalachnospira sp.]